jgi:hypothetical protein
MSSVPQFPQGEVCWYPELQWYHQLWVNQTWNSIIETKELDCHDDSTSLCRAASPSSWYKRRLITSTGNTELNIKRPYHVCPETGTTGGGVQKRRQPCSSSRDLKQPLVIPLFTMTSHSLTRLMPNFWQNKRSEYM